MRKILFLIFIVWTLLTAGCGDSYKNVHDDITGPVQSVKLKPATSVAEGSTEQLSVTVYPSMTNDKRVTWSSSDESHVTVNQNGVITGIADGAATVTATSVNGGITADCIVTVLDMPVAVTGVYLNNSTLTLSAGGSSQLDAGFTPLNPGPTNQGLTWSSNNTSVADVNSTGLVHAISNGTAVITVKTNDGGFSAICVVTVSSTAPPVVPDPAVVTPGNKQISLTWSTVPGADSYEVWFGTVYNSSSATQSGGIITATNHSITGLTNGTVYYIWLKSKNTTGTSGYSSAAWGTPILPSGQNTTYTLPGPITFNMKSLTGGLFPTGIGDSDSYQINHQYWIGETEVTFQLWDAVRTWAISHGYTFANNGAGSGQLPVTEISVRDAMVWCNALTEYYNANNGTDTDLDCVYYTNVSYSTPLRSCTNTAPITTPAAGSEDNPYIKSSVNGNLNMALCSAKGFRLPTSMEWELAARWRSNNTNTVTGFNNPWFTKGNSASGAISSGDTDSVAWYVDNSGGSVHNPGGKTPNSLGLKDMTGNVNEWCFDVSSEDFFGRVYRGGSFLTPISAASTLLIGEYYFGYKNGYQDDLGLRITRTD